MEKVFGIREGELYRALSMQLNIFLIITTLLVLKPTVNSLFLSTYGIESLPNAFIMVAIAAGLVTTLYSRVLQGVRFNYLMNGTLISTVVILLFFGIALRTGFLGDWILYLFYIWVAIFALMATSQFWLLVNMVFNDREIKRLVGFIGAGGIAGGIFGGYLTSFLTNYIASIDLAFVGAFLIAWCIPLTMMIWRTNKDRPKVVQEKAPTTKPVQHPFRMIIQSRHLFLLAGIVALSNVVAKLVDYQFGGIASRLITDPEELTAFFGFWFSTFNVVSLLIQLVATRFVVNKYGVGSSLIILPAVICLAVFVLLLMPELLFAVVMMKMADGSLKQSINKSAMELLYLPIDTPSKNKAKPFIDVFVDSLATGATGMILIFVVKGLSLSTTTINIIILMFVGFWMYLVMKIRKEYLRSFKRKILQNIPGKEVSKLNIQKSTVVGNLPEVLTQGTSTQILYALKQTHPIRSKKLKKLVQNLLPHPSPEIRVEAINHLYHYKDKTIYQEVEKMTMDVSRKVKMAAYSYIIEHTPLKKKKIIEERLNSSDNSVSGLALISLAIQVQNNPKLQKKYELKKRILQKLESLPELTNIKDKYLNRIYCIQAIGYAKIRELYPVLAGFLEHKNPAIVRQAILAAAKTQDAYFVKDLIRLSNNVNFTRAATKAIETYQDSIIGILSKFLQEEPDEAGLSRKYPAIVKPLANQKTIRFLFTLLEHSDPIVRQNALQALSDLHHQNPKLKFKRKKILLQILEEVLRFQNTLAMIHLQMEQRNARQPRVDQARKRLIEILQKRLKVKQENIFRLLGLRYSPENLLVISKGLKNKKQSLRITALEFLDNILETRLKKIITPLFEVAVVDFSRRKNIDKLKLKIPSELECFDFLLTGNENIRVKMATLNLIDQLQNPAYLPLVEKCVKLNDPELKLFAKTVLAHFQQNVYALKSSSH